MRITNLRTHLTSIAIISIVILVIYALFAPASNAPGSGQLQGNRYIQIDAASWGLNCNPYVDDALRNWTPATDPALAAKNPKPHRVLPDNALPAISAACNGKIACRFAANPASIGDDPLPVCPKKLEVRYRCSDFDPLVNKTFNAGADAMIDCRPKPDDAAAKNAPANAH